MFSEYELVHDLSVEIINENAPDTRPLLGLHCIIPVEVGQ